MLQTIKLSAVICIIAAPLGTVDAEMFLAAISFYARDVSKIELLYYMKTGVCMYSPKSIPCFSHSFKPALPISVMFG